MASPQETFERLVTELGSERIFDFHADPKKDKDPWFQVKPASIVELGALLKNDEQFACNFLECVTGVDYPTKDQIAVVYHFYSYKQKHRVIAKAFLPRENPHIPSLTALYSVANWQERECFDLLGVVFEGHPDLRRLLLPDDWEGYPLRKDYVEKPTYHGIPTNRPNPLELVKISKGPSGS